jgi:quercetin dioxygenase-like cupin family protein
VDRVVVYRGRRDLEADVSIEEHVIEEGDAIVVPASPWHHVVADTASVTLSLTELVDLDALIGR